jgi:hypothetical protein
LGIIAVIWFWIAFLLTVTATYGVVEGWMTWGDDYWRLGRLGCVERDYWGERRDDHG